MLPSPELCINCIHSYIGVPVLRTGLPEEVGALCCRICGCMVKLMNFFGKQCPNGGPVYPTEELPTEFQQRSR